MSERIARAFHEAYMRLAPSYGITYCQEPSLAWEKMPDRQLMIAVADEVLGILLKGDTPEMAPCGHPTACVVTSKCVATGEAGTSCCRWCVEVAQLKSESAHLKWIPLPRPIRLSPLVGSKPCDMLQGACVCGATHELGAQVRRLMGQLLQAHETLRRQKDFGAGFYCSRNCYRRCGTP